MERDRQKTVQTKELTKLFKTYNVWSFFGYNKMHMRIIAMAAIYRNKTHAYASSDKKSSIIESAQIETDLFNI